MIGDQIQLALWYLNDEQRAKAEKVITACFEDQAEGEGIQFSPITFRQPAVWEEVPPAPEVGAMIVIGEAIVVSVTHMSKVETDFLIDLEPSTLKQLREATQRAYQAEFPGSPPMSQNNLDQLIAMQAHATYH